MIPDEIMPLISDRAVSLNDPAVIDRDLRGPAFSLARPLPAEKYAHVCILITVS